jgi:hypothetical protein
MEWEAVLRIGVDVIIHFGGPVQYIATNPTKGRRFLVEQMACVELLGEFLIRLSLRSGALTTWIAPRLILSEDTWLQVRSSEETFDHIEHVYGWDR